MAKLSKNTDSYARALKESFDLGPPLEPALLAGRPQERAFKSADSSQKTSAEFHLLVESLNELYKVFQEPQINLFFLFPAIPIELKKQVLKKGFESAGYKGLICSFLYLLLDKKKWGEWPAILKHLNNMKEESQGLVKAEVESAFPLSQALRENLKQQLKVFFGKKVLLKEKLNPHLMGGMKVRAQGFVFDDSLSYHLKKIESQNKEM